MSREIKFRYVFRRKTDGHIYIIEFNVEALEETSRNQLKTMLVNELWELVARDQFTGLKDKNGKEIYEGDIIEYPWLNEKFKAIVSWDNQRAKFYYSDKMFNGGEYLEVIGNIYENKDLLP